MKRSPVTALAAAVLAFPLASGAALAAPTIEAINSFYSTPLYTDSLNSSSGWTVITSAANGAAPIDAAAEFGFNYGTGGAFGPLTVPAIPQAPNGSDALGLIVRAQDVDDAGTDAAQAVAAKLNALPVTSSTAVVVRFDMWTNFVAGSAGSSEFAFYGLGASSAQTSIGAISSGTGSTAGVGPITSGVTFTSVGDGGFARDLRTFYGTAEEIAATNYPAATFPPTTTVPQDQGFAYYSSVFPGGVAAGKWLDVVLFYDGSEVSYYVNGLLIYARSGVTLTPDQLFLGYLDINSSVSPAEGLTFAVYDNLRVSIPEPSSAGLLLGAGLLALRRRR